MRRKLCPKCGKFGVRFEGRTAWCELCAWAESYGEEVTAEALSQRVAERIAALAKPAPSAPRDESRPPWTDTLTPTEMRMFECLREGRLVTPRELALATVGHSFASLGLVRAHLSHLRGKVKGGTIRTVRGRGFRWVRDDEQPERGAP